MTVRCHSLRILLVIGLVGCSFPDDEWFGRIPTPDPTHLRVCNNGEPESLDPADVTSTNAIRLTYELFDGLASFDANGLATPSLAERWEVAPDLRTFTFHLRRDARWSNGRALDAYDVAYTAARTLHALTASPSAEDLWRLVNGRAYTVGSAKVLLRDAAPFRAGDIVFAAEDAPSTNDRKVRAATPLRAGPGGAIWAQVMPGETVTIIELDGPACPARPRPRAGLAACDWAYVHLPRGDGLYGYLPLAALEPGAGKLAVTADTRRGEAPVADLLTLPDVLGVETPDRWTVVFRTNDPVPYFIDVAAQQALRPVPREAISQNPRRWTRPGNIVTSGPFHLARWRQRDGLGMVRSDTFWGRAGVRLARVDFLTVDEQATAVNLYYQGRCDALVQNHMPVTFLPVLAGETRGVTTRAKRDYHRTPLLQAYFYLLNTKQLDNVHLRRALSHALDRSELPLITKGGLIPSSAYVPGRPIKDLTDAELALCGVTRETRGVAMIVVAGEVCYVPPLGPDFDLAAARREWAQAKSEMGAKFPARLSVKYNTGVEQHKLIAEWVQEQWRKHLGVAVDLESQDWQIFIAATRDRDYQIARFGGSAAFVDPENFLRNWLCEHPDNRPGWCNPQYEALFQQAERESDRRKRLALIRQAEELMVAEQPIIPMAIYTQHHLIKPYVKGFDLNLVDHQSLRNAWIDPDWRSR